MTPFFQGVRQAWRTSLNLQLLGLEIDRDRVTLKRREARQRVTDLLGDGALRRLPKALNKVERLSWEISEINSEISQIKALLTYYR